MRRNKGDNLLKQYALYSLLAHLAVLGVGAIPFFALKNTDMMLTDIEIASEGELRDILANDNREVQPVVREEPSAEEVKEEVKREPEEVESKPISEEIKEAIPEEPIKKEESIPEPVKEDDRPEEPSKNEIVDEEKPTREAPSDAKEPEPIKEESKEDPVPREENPPKKEEPKKKIPEVKNKPKKRNRKWMMEAIKTAEKKKAKEKNRKKMLEITERAASNKKRNNAFDKMLSGSINDLKRNVSGKGQKGSGAGSFGSGNSLTDADYEAISSQIYPHWVVPSGVRDAENIIVELRVQLRENGEVLPASAQILDEKRYAEDYIFRAVADSAKRAILEASPLKVPKDKIDLFRDFILRFNMKEALGGYGG